MPHPEREHELMIEVARLTRLIGEVRLDHAREKARADAAEADRDAWHRTADIRGSLLAGDDAPFREEIASAESDLAAASARADAAEARAQRIGALGDAAVLRAEDAERERDTLQALADKAHCSWCGHVGPKTGIGAHMLECEKRPEAQLLDKLIASEEALAAARRECEGLRNALIALDGLRDHKGDCARENEYGATCNCGFDDVQEKVERALGAPGDGEEGTR